MKKNSNLILIVLMIVLLIIIVVFYNAYKNGVAQDSHPDYVSQDDTRVFSDGLKNPDSVTQYELDEFGMGIAEKSTYYIDINQDGIKDRITKIFTETGNAHSYYTYNVELNVDGSYVNITPDNFRTTNGASCDLQQIQFSFAPKFKVTIVARELGEIWTTPTMAYRQEYTLNTDDQIEPGKRQELRPVCDVKELF